jgi:two-component system chemotaxis response regulator CheB
MLSKALMEKGDIEVVGSAADPFEAKDMILRLKPEVITLDVEMPKMNGIEFLKKLLPQYPVPVIVVTSTAVNAFEAISAGAVDYIKKPASNDLNAFSHELRQMVRTAKIAKVMKPRAAVAPGPAVSSLKTSGPLDFSSVSKKIIALGASTGGTEALQRVLENLPPNMPGIVIVQHMPAGFTKMYADRLNRVCKMEVREAVDGDRVKQGLVLIAAGGECHMRLKKDTQGYFVSCQKGEKVSGHCPSVDVLFDSVADTAKADAIGVILTGMGSDGVKGLLKMKQTGAYTIGQDKDTCVVYGMPMVAFNVGAVVRQAPLDAISGILIDRLRRN